MGFRSNQGGGSGLTQYAATGTMAAGASITIEHPADADDKRIPFFDQMISIDGAYVVANMEGANDSSTFVDSSTASTTITKNGSSVVKTAQHKYGSSSGLFSGTTDSIQVPAVSIAGDFTLGCWVRWPSIVANYNAMFRQASGVFLCTLSNGHGLRWGLTNVAEYGTASFTYSTDTWYQIMLTRASNQVRLFINGVQQGSSVSNSNTYTGLIEIGGGGSIPLNGYMDNSFILVGKALKTANFTPEEYIDPGIVPVSLSIGNNASAEIKAVKADANNLNRTTKTTFYNKTGLSLNYKCGVLL